MLADYRAAVWDDPIDPMVNIVRTIYWAQGHEPVTPTCYADQVLYVVAVHLDSVLKWSWFCSFFRTI